MSRFWIDPAPLLAGAEEWGDRSRHLARAVASALKSVGWLVKNRLYAETERLAPLNPHSAVLTLAMARAATGRGGGWVYKYVGRGKKRRRVKYFTRVGSSKRGTGGGTDTPPFRRVRNSLRYRLREDNAVQIGFLRGGSLIWGLSQSIAEQADAANQPVTAAMRRFFFAAGLPLRKGTTSTHRPARPWFEQTLNRCAGEIRVAFATKFFDAMERYGSGRGQTA